jgi:hypothetical protein
MPMPGDAVPNEAASSVLGESKPRRDYLGIFFGLTTVLGLALAYYWHAQSVQERVPTYYVNPARARIIDTSIPIPSELQVLYQGKNLNANVGAVVVYFWNDGKLPIKADDVLEPLRIELDPTCVILDARLLKTSRSVTRFAKGEVSEGAKNSLPLSFSILERNDGASFQIIYSGNSDTDVSVKGTVVGAGKPRLLAPDEKSFEASARRRTLKIQAVLAELILAIAGLVSGYFWGRGLGPRGPRPANSMPTSRPRVLTFANATLSFVCLVLIGFGLWLSHNAVSHLSPAVPGSIWMKQ